MKNTLGGQFYKFGFQRLRIPCRFCRCEIVKLPHPEGLRIPANEILPSPSPRVSRRVVSKEAIRALPPITTTVCPRSVGSR